ncbi:D-threo-3-hydroxyaspartate dehydratase-like isoform X1 [Portunus trituberculatus]|uniref:D-threo-3-hydroxyaspartate dehydratase-like isoform X1 n=1 Tax=Portunus trituberculatus TaxID=210409 RepID=UPI001E1CB500|nr:D-threo-3-hydroxyaspartate dehydratase-like isoform X1 [Portunus trituberculatus]
MASQEGSARRVAELDTPAFLVDFNKVSTNCAKALAQCTELGVTLRAQTKTHKTIEGAVLQTGGTRRGLVTSTIQEAEFYADNGFDDILFGFPFIPHHMPRAAQLTRRLEKFHVMVDSRVAVDVLVANTPPPGKTWSAYLAVNCGYNREGVWWESSEGEELACLMDKSPSVTFAGVYVHCGNSYSASQPRDVERVREETIERLLHLVGRIKARGVACPVLGIGSTPTCSHPGPSMRQLTELHPGNYIFYDAQQMVLGSCKEADIACCVATRVIGHYPDRNQLLIDCGFSGLTKQGTGQLPSGCCIFRDQPNLKLDKMTQEVGFVNAVKGHLNLDDFPIGCMLFILPWHSCATAAMYPVYHVVEDDAVVAEWRPTRGW